jgi:hypothetical protein
LSSVAPISVGSTATVGSEILFAASTLSGAGSVAAVARTVVSSSASLSGSGTVPNVACPKVSVGTADSVGGSGIVAIVAKEVLLVAKELSGSGSVPAVSVSADRLVDPPTMSGAGTVTAAGVIQIAASPALSGSGSISVQVTHGGRATLSTNRSRLGVMEDWLYLMRLDNNPVTEQNRKFGITEQFRSVSTVSRANGDTTRFFPADYNKKVFKFTWKFISNDKEGNFDFLNGRDYLKSVADADSIHTLGLRSATSSPFDAAGEYSVVVKSYSENLVRRAVVTDTVDGVESDDAEIGTPLNSDSKYGKYFWDVSLELEEV